MTVEEQLEKIKSALGITGTYQDNALMIYIDDVKAYMSSAGITEATINAPSSIGVICRGVADIWNYGAGGTELSTYFKERVTQLKLSEVVVND